MIHSSFWIVFLATRSCLEPTIFEFSKMILIFKICGSVGKIIPPPPHDKKAWYFVNFAVCLFSML